MAADPEVIDLYLARAALPKSWSLLVARAYAAAYASVLTEEAGVHVQTVSVPSPHAPITHLELEPQTPGPTRGNDVRGGG